MKTLIIVESPTKAKTISKFLNSGYIVKSSFGHIRDLPKSKMGIDIEHDFAPEYEVGAKSKTHVSELKKIAKDADKIIIATDEDREGEAIAWHIAQILNLGEFGKGKNKKEYERIVFHEITKSAIERALANPRKIDLPLVDAQQARRVLDRLVGYELSPFLWKKIRYGLSAGRVQSVAVRLIVEREEEIKKFIAEEYWSIDALLNKITNYKLSASGGSTEGGQIITARRDSIRGTNKSQNPNPETKTEITAKLVKINNDSVPKLGIKTKEEAEKIKNNLEKASYRVMEIKKKETQKNPLPPFTTSTLQQAASNLFGYSAKQTMMIAQQLYEGIELGGTGPVGLITYMRTDSLNLSEDSLKSANKYITEKFGKEYSSPEPRRFKTKSKGAQEAHEAIRPTHPEKDPESVKEYLDPKQFKLYRIIWQRMVASQMASAIVDSTTIDIEAKNSNENIYILRAAGSVIKFYGYLKVYPSKAEDVIFPALAENEKLDLLKIINEQHFTQPPARYNEASLIKALEEFGIGRPSTYAPTISTIQDRGYVEKIEKRFHPKEIGALVNKLLVAHFPQIVDIKFTAEMEESLDDVAENKKKWVPLIKDFYGPFKKNLTQKDKEIKKKDLVEEKTDEKCEKCGSPMIIKLGRFGKFMACTNYPDCKTTKPLGEEKELKEKFAGEVCEKCGKPMAVKQGRFGSFLGCTGYPDCKNIKPIVQSTGIKCPDCEIGDVVLKKTKTKRIFWGCSKYPECKYATWKKPEGKTIS